jgi:ferredoxin-NADP reductase
MNDAKYFKSKILARSIIARETLFVSLQKPEGFRFQAGQYITLEIPGVSLDGKSNARDLSIASAPSDENLEFAVRLRDSWFKKELASLPLGSEVLVSEATGNLIVPENSSRPLVFLAGGIGIVPFRSILREMESGVIPAQNVRLFYSNRLPEDISFFEELLAMEKKHEWFSFFSIITREEDHITKERLEKHLENFSEHEYFIAGPWSFFDGMVELMNSCEVEKPQVHTERFCGYKSVCCKAK